MNVTQYLKNKQTAIEEYLETPNDPIKSYKLFKPDKHSFFNERNHYTYSKRIRKSLQSTKDYLSKMSQKEILNKTYTKGLYHNRNDDFYDTDHIDCVEDGFCMNHSRDNEKRSSKYHYHCKYGRCTHSYKEPKMVHGEKKWFSNKFVCFGCRKCITRRNLEYICRDNWPKCSRCQKYMTGVSVAFQAPAKHDIKHWKQLDKEWYDDSRITYNEYKNICKINN